MEKSIETIIIDSLNKLFENQKEMTECLSKLDKTVSLNMQKTEYELQKINSLDEHQNKLIDEHIAGVNTLKEILAEQKKEYRELIRQHEERDRSEKAALADRFKPLEEPRIAWKYFLYIAGGIGTISGAVYTILKFFVK